MLNLTTESKESVYAKSYTNPYEAYDPLSG